ncbi:unnamed protein product [Leptosia nina]|uniref:GDT1 family protein n=1 Tax=Leptosia nina TaxID=320188 RepID=A0AAV1J1Y7_9NEOP
MNYTDIITEITTELISTTDYVPSSEYLSSTDFLKTTDVMFTTDLIEASTLPPETGVREWLLNLVVKNAAVKGSFWQGFLASLSVVIVSELADKTFFIAAIMAMKHSRIIVFSGAISALVFMTVLSAAFGWVATVVPRVYTHYISAALFAIFGLKMLRDGWKMDPSEGQEELDEVQTELKRREEQEDKEETVEMLEQGQAETKRRKRNAVLKVLLQAATLTFLAEWGDRSQLATVVLATREDVFGVVVGGSLGHALCTGLAVIGGRMVAQKISVRTVTIIGGLVFLFFAVSALIMGPGE